MICFRIPLLVALAAGSLFGTYTYYYSDNLTSINSAAWTQNGVISAGSGGLTSSDSSGGSLISKIAVPDGTSDYEVRTTFHVTPAFFVNGLGTFVTYLHASSDALSGPGARGSSYAFELQNPTLTSGGAPAPATLAGYKIVNGVVTTMFSTTVMCHDQMTLRAVYVSRTYEILVYVDDALIWLGWNNDIPSGKPGVGVRGSPTSNTISQVQLGPLDRVAPVPVPQSSIGVAAYSNHVDLQWPATTDDANGIGVFAYEVVRDGRSLKWDSTRTFSDTNVTFSSTYTYAITVYDQHMNTSTTTVTATTPSAGNIQARQVGIRSAGTYWGGLGENIDMQGGNLNFSLPLLRAKGRGNWSAPFNLIYNSQNWRKDSGGTWKTGYDVGYGFGWKLMAGSIVPTSYGTPHFIFTDASGAEYNLDQNTGTLWTSTEGIYVTYDSSNYKLYFNDGSFWTMGCTSANTEADAGTLYPTTMQDSNGNQVLIRYYAGAGVSWTNSSARIQEIEDVRAVPQGPFPSTHYMTYAFNYDASRHLQSITNTISTSESYTFSLSSGSLVSPFSDHLAYGTTSSLLSVAINGVGLSYQFATDGYGQLLKATFPYGGYLRWDYNNYQYAGGRLQPEVLNRYLSKDGTTGSEKTYPLTRDTANDANRSVHYWADIWDPDGKSDKYWLFALSGQFTGLATDHGKRQLPGSIERSHEVYTWAQGTAGPYVSSVLTTMDPGSGQAQKKTTQSIDAYGNVTQSSIYDWNSLTTPARTYNNTYVTDANYTSRYIRNRLLSSTVTGGGQTVTLATNVYDCYGGVCSTTNVSDPSQLREHDGTYDVNFHYRGNLLSHTDPGAVKTFAYDISGNALNGTAEGVTKNYAVPASMTTNSLSQTMQWSGFLGLTQETGPNGDTLSTLYDSYARPQQTTSATGVVTNYTYATSAPWTVTAIANGRGTRKTLDGFGRTVKVESGTGTGLSTVVSVTDTQYDPCACSPMGKVSRASMPHAPGATQYWTVNSYDALGRTVSVVSPDGSSTKTYAYAGNTATVTDEAGKWKKYSMDAMGNLLQVTEPDPANPTTATYVTNYGYDVLSHLTSVNMPRPTGTQTRTFNYATPPGAYLLSATNPESGTVSYTYNSNGLLLSKMDAKNQQTQYGYDSYARLTQIRHYPVAGGSEDVAAQVNMSYDTNPYDGSYSQYALGRMAARQYTNNGTTFTDMYSYTRPGQVARKKLRVMRYGVNGDLEALWSYDNEGRRMGVTYPNGQAYAYSYDTMGRPNAMTDPGTQQPVISSVSYGPAGELLTMLGVVNETRTYNLRLQLTALNNVSYVYPAANNGKIQSQTDSVSGEQITYAYDALNRLISGVTSDNPNVTQWGQGFTYDGFGNLTGKSVTKGTAPYLSVGVDAATNRIVGYQYDANGNQTWSNTQTLGYDYDNRMVNADNRNYTGSQYGYDPDNKRVYTADWTYNYNTSLTTVSNEVVYFFGVTGQRMAAYTLVAYASPPTVTLTRANDRVYFGGKMIRGDSGQWADPDRLGSVGTYFPYGENRNGGGGMFATYSRDGSGLDYADQRYYWSNLGRFMSPDPYRANSAIPDSAQWNRYAYVGSDPVTYIDPRGLFMAPPPSSPEPDPEPQQQSPFPGP